MFPDGSDRRDFLLPQGRPRLIDPEVLPALVQEAEKSNYDKVDADFRKLAQKKAEDCAKKRNFEEDFVKKMFLNVIVKD